MARIFRSPMMRPAGTKRVLLIFTLVMVAPVLIFVFWSAQRKDEEEPGVARTEDAVEDLVATEEWIELMGAEMNRRMSSLSEFSAGGFGLPLDFAEDWDGGNTMALLDEGTRPAGISLTDYRFVSQAIGGRSWNFESLNLHQLRGGRFGFLSGKFPDESRTRFVATVVFSIKGSTEDGRVASFQSEQEIRWEMSPGGAIPAKVNDYLIDPADWKITGWKMKGGRVLTSSAPLFQDVTEEVISDRSDFSLIEATDHARYLETLFSGGRIPLKSQYGRYFTTDATAQHPGLSVVDIDDDGRDDLYVCVRWGKNLLFRNKADGTFEEVAAEYGLDLDGLSAAAIFADFDNDGDQDVFVGRSLEKSVYLRNEGGIFVDCSSSHVDSPLPYLTTSLAAADYNGDGLLDLYCSTYGFAMRQAREQVAKDFLQDYHPAEVSRRFVSPPDVEPYLNLPGPPNILFVNKGDGRFEISPLNEQVAVWHETLQTTWADYDLDGDPDLYVCNDFAPDQLFRNDHGEKFVDVTASVGHERMRGFGMGASFGDFDNDLDLDLYVSNMFSKAGLRIIDKVGLADKRFRWSAEGNLLFGNDGDSGFRFLTGQDAFKDVARADWSWGGQFCDFDNDGFLDLYVPNGYFTAPGNFAGEADL